MGTLELVAGEPMAAGATQALGASDAESYGVWYALRGRATIGNAAYDAGAAACDDGQHGRGNRRA